MEKNRFVEGGSIQVERNGTIRGCWVVLENVWMGKRSRVEGDRWTVKVIRIFSNYLLGKQEMH